MSNRRAVQSITMGLTIIFALYLFPRTSSGAHIEVRDPMSGDAWFSHDVRTIHWQADVPPAKVRIELYKRDGHVLTIASDCDNTETYIWTVPEKIVSGGDYRIKIVDIMDKTNYCFSEYFRIVSDILPGSNSTTSPLETSRQWDIYTVDTGNVGFYSSIDVDNQNRPHMSYYDAASDDLKYAYWDGSQWQIEIVDQSGDVGRWTSIAVDKTTNDVHISYCHEGDRDLKYAYWNGSVWDIDLVDGQGSNRGEYTSIALDSYGNPHISYINGDVGDIMWAYKIAGPPWWGTHLVDDDHDTGRYTSIAFASNDYPHFSYHDYTWSLFNYRRWCKYAYYNGSSFPNSWVDTRNYTGYFTSIVLDNSDLPHISYQGASNCDYAHWTGASWQRVALDPDGGSASGWSGTSIVLDPGGDPHIAYYRRTSTSLGYAYWDGAEWVLEIVDDDGDVGGNCSMVLDDAGYLHISYADYSNGVLKYATTELVGIEEDTRQTDGFSFQIMSNPSHTGRSIIRYGLAKSDNVRIIVYNTLGQAIRTLVDKEESAGVHTVLWDGNDYSGTKVSAGVYFLKYNTGDYTASEKLLLLK